MVACPRCKASLETPLACGACGALLPCADGPSPFTVFGLPERYAIDRDDLRRRLLRFGRATHPDFFATTDPSSRALAERNNAILNEAHAVLADDVERAEWLLRARGADAEAERAMPPEFLLEVLDWNESLDDFRRAKPGDVDRSALDELKRTLTSRRDEALAMLSHALSDANAVDGAALRDPRRNLNAIRYLDRALGELERLSLADARRA